MIRHFIKTFAYFVYIFIVILIFNYCCYYILLQRMPLYKVPKYRKEGHEKVLGWLNTDRPNSFVHYSREKEPGTLRIVCLGDSFTYGSEVRAGSDFPKLLQDILEKKSNKIVEVINFGVGGYGAHQTFMLWDIVAKYYSPDVVIYGPLTDSKLRDSTFNVTFTDVWDFNKLDKYNSYLLGNVSARYILEGDAVKLISPVGNRRDTSVKQYLKFLPPLRYIRYDRRAPMFITAPMLLFFPNKRLKKNPFYYHPNLEYEMEQIERLLIKKIASEVPLVIYLIKNDLDVVRIREKKNIIPVHINQYYGRLYYAFWNHFSFARNKLLAYRLFDILNNRDSVLPFHQFFSTLLRFDSAKINSKPLWQYSDISLKINDLNFCRFYDASFLFEDYCIDQSCESKVKTFSGVSSLIGFKTISRSFLDAIFIPLPFELREGMNVTLKVVRTNHSLTKVLKRITREDELLNMSILDVLSVSSSQFQFNNQRLTIDFTDQIEVLEPSDKISIFIDNFELMSTVYEEAETNHLSFKSFNNRYILISASGKMEFDPFSPESVGTIDLVYRDNDKSTKIAVAGWRKKYNKIKNPRHYIHSRN